MVATKVFLDRIGESSWLWTASWSNQNLSLNSSLVHLIRIFLFNIFGQIASLTFLITFIFITYSTDVAVLLHFYRSSAWIILAMLSHGG